MYILFTYVSINGKQILTCLQIALPVNVCIYYCIYLCMCVCVGVYVTGMSLNLPNNTDDHEAAIAITRSIPKVRSGKVIRVLKIGEAIRV